MLTTLLVLATWLIAGVAIVGIGLLVPRRYRMARNPRSDLLSAIWAGTAGVVILVLILNFFLPIRSLVVGLILGALGGLGALRFSTWMSRHRGILQHRFNDAWQARRWAVLAFLALVVLGIWACAQWAAGEPTDADLGLYRLNLVLYSSDYTVIPGLANLHERFGFGSSVWPLAATLGNFGWGAEGYRLLTGVVVFLTGLTLLIRILIPRKGGATTGDYFLAIAVIFSAGIGLGDPGRWISSPNQDMLFLLVGAVAVSFFLDWIESGSHDRSLAWSAITVAAVCGSVRPLGWILFGGIGIIAIVVSRTRSSSWSETREFVGHAWAMPAALLAVMCLRDVIATGWLFYPMAMIRFPVDWATLNPSPVALAITAYARGPQMDVGEALRESTWIGPWTSVAIRSWEIKAFGALVVIACLPVLWKSGRTAWRTVWRPATLSSVPSLVLGGVWLFSAPDLRFGWMALIGTAGVACAFLFGTDAYNEGQLRAVGVTAIAMSLYAAAQGGWLAPRGAEPRPVWWTLGPLVVPIELTPHRSVGTTPGTLGDGSPSIHPAESEQCWSNFPVCLLTGAGSDVEMRGTTIQDGFRRM
jgi:hypothetical protein